MSMAFPTFLVGLFIMIIVFLILRWFWLWYWKIDRIVELLEKIDDNTRKPKEKMIPKKTKDDKKPLIKEGLEAYIGDDGVDCPSCKHNYNPNELKCPNCGRANPKK